MSQNPSIHLPYWRIPEWFQGLSSTQLSLFLAYHTDLLKWTKKINLISPSTHSEADRIHFSDCILGSQLFGLEVKSRTIMDQGSGNGLPGIIFAILNPEVSVECVDSDERKIAFIKQFALRQGLKNLKARCRRIEKLEEASVNFGMAKALGSVAKILELNKTCAAANSTLFLFKGPEWVAEVAEAQKKCSTWNVFKFGHYKLPHLPGGPPEERVILRATRR